MKMVIHIFSAIFAAVWLILAVLGIGRMVREGGKHRWLIASMGFLVIVGSVGFFAQMLSAEGLIRLPNSYEWPAGYATHVKQTADGKYVVPLVPSGRVQIYDPHWHFLLGWNVDALGGDFKVLPTPKGTIEVFTARGEQHYSYTVNGDLVSAMTFSEPLGSIPDEGQSVVVPTSPILWIFTHPFISWGVMVLGFIGLALVRKFTRTSPKA